MAWGIFGRKSDAPTPTRAPERHPRRAAMAFNAVRGYVAGEVDRLTESWSTTPKTAREVVDGQRNALVARSREQYRNNEYAHAYVKLLQANVVGPQGLRLQAKVRTAADEVDEEAQAALEWSWQRQCTARNFDVAQRLSFVDFQNLHMQGLAVDGEPLNRIRRGPDFGEFGFALESIDSLRLPHRYNKTLADGAMIRQGIEYDGHGRIVAHHIMAPIRHAVDGPPVKADVERVLAKDVIHYFVPLEVEQLRGLPLLSPVLRRLRMIDAYAEAALVAARVGAAKVALLKSPDDDEFEGDRVEADGSETISAEPGEFQNIGNMELAAWSPEYPRGEYDPFMRRHLQGVSAALNIQYSSVTKDHTGDNYSSMQAGRAEDQDTYEALQLRLVDGFANPVFWAWFAHAATNGKIRTRQGKPIGLDRFRDMTVGWVAKRWRPIDPVKDANASRLEVMSGFRSRSSVIREKGFDPDEVFDEIAKDQKKLAALGIEVDDSGGVAITEQDGKNPGQEE